MNQNRPGYPGAPVGQMQQNYPQQPYPPQVPSGQVPSGQVPSGQLNPAGQMPQGQMPQGQMPQSQMPQGQMPPQGYAPQQNGGYAPQQGYAPQGGAYAPQGQPMPQGYPQGYAPQGGVQYPPQGQQLPPQGYPQQGAPAGYAPPQGYPQGRYPGYPPQQGYAGQQPYPQQPYMGGQVPPQYQPPQQKKPISYDRIAVIVLCALPLLFVLGLVLVNAALKWIFIVLAAAAIAALWVRPIVAPNTRLTFTTVYAALAVVALVSALSGTAPADATNGGAAADTSGAVTASSNSVTLGDVSTAGDDSAAPSAQNAGQALVTVTDEPTLETDAAVSQLKSFFYFWQVNKIDDMVGLCAPSWISSVEAPKTELFSILANRLPTEYDVEKISGTASDTTRTATLTATIDKQNGRDPSKYRFAVVMLKENDVWYVDPRSLSTNEPVVTATPEGTETVAPVAAVATVDPNMVLYYNPDGGTKYHAVQNCTQSTAAKFLPFKGSFKYSQINDEPYKSLTYCNVCNAPARP